MAISTLAFELSSSLSEDAKERLDHLMMWAGPCPATGLQGASVTGATVATGRRAYAGPWRAPETEREDTHFDVLLTLLKPLPVLLDGLVDAVTDLLRVCLSLEAR